jgi:2-phospho-L-lactate transferase/gluconeogenesis factor (CofD/UPF0052 family)
MWQPGETTDFRASDHVRAIHRHAGGKFLDYAIVNLRPILSAAKKQYARQQALPVENDIDTLFKMGLKVMAGNFASRSEKIRHDPAAAAAVVMKLAEEGRAKKSGTGMKKATAEPDAGLPAKAAGKSPTGGK